MTASGGIVEVQGTAEGAPFSPTELMKMVELSAGAFSQLFAAQQQALG
jgi:ribonuclease PH